MTHVYLCQTCDYASEDGPAVVDHYLATRHKGVDHHFGTRACACGHDIADHPRSRFRSCARCLWCDEYRQEWRR